MFMFPVVEHMAVVVMAEHKAFPDDINDQPG